MNNRGQTITVGAIILTFVAVIVGLAIFDGGITNPVAQITQTVDVTNQTATFGVAGSNTTLKGQAISNVVVTNATGFLVPATNYTINNYQVSNGQLITSLTVKAGNVGFAGNTSNVSYTYEPYGYATQSGSRAIIGLIVIFAALAIGLIALVPTLRSGILEFVGR